MAHFLGLGLTHYPLLAGTDEHMADLLRWTLTDPDIPGRGEGSRQLVRVDARRMGHRRRRGLGGASPKAIGGEPCSLP